MKSEHVDWSDFLVELKELLSDWVGVGRGRSPIYLRDLKVNEVSSTLLSVLGPPDDTDVDLMGVG